MKLSAHFNSHALIYRFIRQMIRQARFPKDQTLLLPKVLTRSSTKLFWVSSPDGYTPKLAITDSTA